jgi:hypothetical protein
MFAAPSRRGTGLNYQLVLRSPLMWTFALSVLGAIADWRYRRRGGARSSRRGVIIFCGITGAFLMLIVVLQVMGGSTRPNIGYRIGIAAMWMFAVWELARWKIRRGNPVL